MTTVPLNNWGFTHKVKKPQQLKLDLNSAHLQSNLMFFFSKYTKIQEIKDIKVKKETIIGT